MKTKILLFTILSLLIFSCKSDDENAGPPPIPADEKLIENIQSDGLNYQFEYNSDKTIRSLNIPQAALLLNYSYENNRIAIISLIGNGESLDYHLEYDANGKISSFSLDDVITPVTYNAAENYYLYQKENGDEFTLHLNENHDIYKAIEYDPENEETESSLALYDNSGKGVLTNTNNITVPTVLISGEVFFGFYLFPVSNKPIETFSITGGTNLVFENEFDEQGFIKKSIVSSEGVEVELIYNYTQL